MKALDVKFEWYNRKYNPKFLVEDVPAMDDFRFIKRGPLYFAELGGLVRFYHYEKPGEGFGGREFSVILEDGTEETLIGPWSSGPSYMNRKAFIPSIDISYTENKDAFERGYTFFAGHATVEWVDEALERLTPNMRLRGFITSVPVSVGDESELSSEQLLVVQSFPGGPTQDETNYVIVKE